MPSRRLLILSVASLSIALSAAGQSSRPYSSDQIKTLVADFKEDPRGPFQIVQWFCPDGTVLPARERCPTPGGQQHAVPKDVVKQIGVRNRVYLGQILAGTDTEAFLDAANGFSRVKQYQLERFLARTDDGWIFRQARYYRGAYQAEDEEAWGEAFLRTVLGRDQLIRSRFYILREAARDLPHGRSTDTVQKTRSLSQEISDVQRNFLDIRIKIHGQPSEEDVRLVAEYRSAQRGRLTPEISTKLDSLYANLVRQYRVDFAKQLAGPAGRLRSNSQIAADVRAFDFRRSSAPERAEFFANMMARIRTEMPTYTRQADRVALIDLSLLAESIVFRNAGEWNPTTRRDLIRKAGVLRTAAFGSGLLEAWELEEQARGEVALAGSSLSAGEFKSIVDRYQRAVEWSAALATSAYADVIALFHPFEPLADGFVDDRIRLSILLPFGDTVSKLGEEYASHVGLQNDVLGLDAASARGLNPGVALGQLEVVTGDVDHIAFLPDRIYVMARTPAELKPVGGIATVSEGNMVSHVQLLARNLGIPNAVFPQDLVSRLARHSGERVFYAVSPGGRVRMKLAASMTPEERALVEERERSEEMVRVPTNRLDLNNTDLTSLYALRATDSGRVCGPKAANLGQLSALFPDRVAPGFIVPFGVFRQHMDQPMAGSGKTYWQTLQQIFAGAASRRSAGASPTVVDDEVLAALTDLRAQIEKMPLRPEFVAAVRRSFQNEFGAALGKVAIFVRSDTNMEDLKDFTGAGLNLTVPNVVTEAAIFDAIRRVWASPFRERGYRWRQKYLLNPEDVYPSLLILKSVNVQKSGVMITSGVTSGSANDYTVAFNRGVGGAVDGQAAESYLLASDRSVKLLYPAREPSYTVLPPNGGLEKRLASFEERILSPADIELLFSVGAQVRRTLPGQPGIETAGPFDVELGFDGTRLVLFQARPFVQNKNAGSLGYLGAMDQTRGTPKPITLDQ